MDPLRKQDASKQRKSSEQQALRYDQYELSKKEWILYAGAGTAFCGLVSYVFYRSLLIFFLILPIGLIYPLYMKKSLMERRLHELNLQFKEAVLILASLLSAGYSVENALAGSKKQLSLLYGDEGMITEEFQLMEKQVRMNRPVEQALMEFADRSGLEDVKNFAEVFASAKRSGGELVEIMNHTAGVISDKVQVQEEILTLTASKQFEQKIMNMIPFFIVFYIDFTSPGFFGQMYATSAGRIIMTVCLGVYLTAYWLSDKFMKIEV